MKKELTKIFRDIMLDSNLNLLPNMTPKDISNWDSFNHLNLILALEDMYVVEFSSEEIDSISSVKDLIKYLEKKGITSDF